MTTCLLRTALAFGCLAISGAYTFPVVRTPLGSVRGVDYGAFMAFKGLPYAERPRRFAPPVPKLPWPDSETLDATRFGDACVSGGSHRDSDPLESYGESEDCLHANVWVPKVARRGLPVMVWIHGGGFMGRTANYAGYWGDGFVTHPDAEPTLLVTFNYRLAIFGFYSSEDTGANFGFQDQQVLLRWVRDNIVAFGGDPSRVTLGGQSAGAMSVVCHLAAPGSAGLFSRAIASSPVGLYYRSPEQNAPFVRTVAKAVGCSWAWNVTECMRSRPYTALKVVDIAPEYLFHLHSPCDGCDNILPWLPVVDGSVLPVSPVDAFRSGTHHKVPTIISTTRNETLAFVPTLLREAADNILGYELSMRVLFNGLASEVKRHYAKSPDMAEVRDRVTLVGVASTDALMTCYSRYVVKLLSQYAPAFLSTFMLPVTSSEMHQDSVCVRGPPEGACCHAADLAYQLPHSARMTQRDGVAYNGPEEFRAALSYTAALIGFAYGSSGPFVPYTSSSDVSIQWNSGGVSRTSGYHKDHCDLLESIGFVDAPWGGDQGRASSIFL